MDGNKSIFATPNSRKIKVLTITSNDLGISWGPAIHYLELWTQVCKLDPRYVVTGLCPSWTKNEPIIVPNFELKRKEIPDVRGWRQVYFDFIVALFLLAKRKQYDLIYIRLSHWHFLQILILRLLKLPYFIELNGLSKEDSGSAGKRKFISKLICWQEKMLLEKAVKSIAVSEGISKAVIHRYSLNPEKVTYIKNGVANDFFNVGRKNRSHAEQLKGIYVGTFTSWDGSDLLPDLAHRFSGIKFDIVGEGDARKNIQKLSPSNMIFHGKVNYSQLIGYYAEADFGLVLYEFERHRNVQLSSLKTLEYVATNLPIFTTAVPGQEFIEELGIGYLLKENEDLYLAFEGFLGNLDRYNENYKKVRHKLPSMFGWLSTASKTMECIERALPK